ncbi:helix-turn-helix domain-containing protein [Telmatospirillum sp.]|uniref:AraC family transcriptional regulator n=1 Tax=Telmatospirillum sp. TaxID=2079197 RepID=UPI002843F793|nr:helix-turn-helix domain-containing protein [Telmatospirillum sp.]MDR3435562.1 helix-turn-helix domain-containing protein [Telmatospirillum sp.]
MHHDTVSHWSTDEIDPNERFAYWREALSANLIGVTPEAPSDHRRQFAGSLSRIPIADTAVMQLRMDISKLRTNRTATDIRNTPGDGLFLFRTIDNPVNFLFPERDGFVAHPGTTTIGGLDRERISVAEESVAHRIEVLRLPAAAFRGIMDNPECLDPRPVAEASGADALLHTFFQSFMRELPRLDGHDRVSALATLTNLTIAALRPDRRGEEPQRDAIRAARLRSAHDYIARHAADPALAPDTVAAALGMSTRQLHGLFETSAKSFSRHLAAERVDRAVRALTFDPSRSITEIAFACGFESLPTFYRAFRTIVGMTPTELRISATAAG